MSIFNILRGRKTLNGSIKINDKNFGFFGMSAKHVKTKLSTSLDIINRNLQDKRIGGYVRFCEFEGHDGPHISLWMSKEALENSSKSIENYIGKQGTFEVIEYDITKNNNTILLIVKGKCPVAKNTRAIAKITKRNCYEQHMTVGKFKKLNVPEVITKIHFGYEKMLAEEFLKINILTTVKVELMNEHLEHWELEFDRKNKKIIICVNLEERNQYIVKFETNCNEKKMKLNLLINTMWVICETMLEFVLFVDLVLWMDKTAKYLEENIWFIHEEMMADYRYK